MPVVNVTKLDGVFSITAGALAFEALSSSILIHVDWIELLLDISNRLKIGFALTLFVVSVII